MNRAESQNLLPERCRVLLAEACEVDAALLVAMLKKEGRFFEITHENEPLSLIRKSDALDVDIALLSLDLSHEVSAENCALIQRVSMAVPTIILSAETEIDAFRQAIEAGAQDCIQKNELKAGSLGFEIERAAVRYRFARDLALRGQRASDASKAKTNFLSAMSHEIRTPLNALLGVAELLENSELTPEQADYVRVFRRSGQSLLSLINGVLDLASIERGKFELIVSQFSIRELIEDVAENFSFAAHQKGLALIVEVAPSVAELVQGDAERIRQILINLVSNAIKFTQAGHVSLRARRGEQDRIVFEVRDSGVGVDPTKLEKIFAPFEQAEHDPEHVYGGTGLGLALCRGLAERMGGTILAKPTEAAGAHFELCLPLTPKSNGIKPVRERHPTKWNAGEGAETQRDSDAKAAHREAVPPGTRILHAEDSADNRLLVRAYLRDSGAVITEVHDGTEAVEAYAAGDFDIVLMDVLMPRMDGLEATRRIREFEAREGCSPTPIIALTANAFSEQVENCMRAGTTLHIAKPMSQAMLMGGLSSVLTVPKSPMQKETPAAQHLTQPIDTSLIDSDILPLLPTYLFRRESERAALRQNLAEQDFEALRVVGHNLKGTGTGYGLPEITEIGARMEEAAKKSDPDAIGNELEQLDRVINAALEAIGGSD